MELLTLSECSELKQTIDSNIDHSCIKIVIFSFCAAVYYTALLICLCCVYIFVACISFIPTSNDIITRYSCTDFIVYS